MTGAVWVNGELDREPAEQVILVVGVKDLHAAKGGQTATGENIEFNLFSSNFPFQIFLQFSYARSNRVSCVGVS